MSTRLSSEEIAELRRLIQSLYDGRITSDERVRLKQWMYQSEEVSWIYVQYMNLYAGLHWDTAQELQPDQAVPDTTPKQSQSPVLGFLGDVPLKVLPVGLVIPSRILIPNLPAVHADGEELLHELDFGLKGKDPPRYPQAGHKLVHVHRLGEEVVGSGVHGFQVTPFSAQGG